MGIGETAQRKLFNKLTPYACDIEITKMTGSPQKCPGGWDEDSNEFDAALDYDYHQANPAAPACTNGLTNEFETETIKGFIFESLSRADIEILQIGNFEVGEAVFITSGIPNLINLVTLHYRGEYYKVEFIRDLVIANVVIARYGKIRKSPVIV
jgi:hypothetical protein